MFNAHSLRPDLLAIASLVAPGSRVLDIGCSDGALLQYLARQKQVDGRGIELSQALVSEGVKRGLSVIQGNVDTDLLHYPQHAFDYVISSQMLQATQNPRHVLEHMQRIGRHSIVSIPNFGHWRNRLYLLCKGRMPVTETLSYQWYETPNIHFSTVKDFTALCRELGFTIKAQYFLDARQKPLRGLRKCLPNVFSDTAVFLLA